MLFALGKVRTETDKIAPSRVSHDVIGAISQNTDPKSRSHLVLPDDFRM
ncbi:hypothetical protein LY56_03357 [Roseinatronobacter thiooxidans]|uniref:Uncharacterized protein n=1 Tax=Roseinatronobacter thiooxidans TaxID=121821 RepID=A0A2W7PSV0_9RHOB|nr:hypothetical protein LY56_03357 [Roseinatronobacter thiooxidans]